MSARKPEHLVSLLRQAARGNESSLEDLLTRLHLVILRFLSRRLTVASGAASLIDDAAIEALTRIVRAVGQCRAGTDAELISWALAVARTSAIDLLRQELAHATSELDSSAEQQLSEADHSQSVGRLRSPAEQALMDLVLSVHDALPDDLQLLLWLRLVEGAPWTAVGEELGTTAEGAKRRFQRGQDKLRREVLRRIPDLEEAHRSLVRERLASLGIDA